MELSVILPHAAPRGTTCCTRRRYHHNYLTPAAADLLVKRGCCARLVGKGSKNDECRVSADIRRSEGWCRVEVAAMARQCTAQPSRRVRERGRAEAASKGGF